MFPQGLADTVKKEVMIQCCEMFLAFLSSFHILFISHLVLNFGAQHSSLWCFCTSHKLPGAGCVIICSLDFVDEV